MSNAEFDRRALVLTEEWSSESLVGEALVGDEEVVRTVSVLNLEGVQLLSEKFHYNVQEMHRHQLVREFLDEAEKERYTNLLILQYPVQCSVNDVHGEGKVTLGRNSTPLDMTPVAPERIKKLGGAHVRHKKAPENFVVVPLHFIWLYKHN